MEALDFLAALMEKMYGLKVALKGAQLSTMPKEEVGNLLFQIVRELLFNVVKHAGVNQAQVEVAQEGDRLSIIVSDDGQGFDAIESMQQNNSLGLFTIRRRVELFGGQFHIESQAGQGTRVAVVTWV
jgi:signal transduction histidine kinase